MALQWILLSIPVLRCLGDLNLECPSYGTLRLLTPVKSRGVIAEFYEVENELIIVASRSVLLTAMVELLSEMYSLMTSWVSDVTA